MVYKKNIVRNLGRKNVLEKVVLTLFMIISLFLLSISMSFGLVTIDNIDSPLSLDENTLLTASFSASTNLNSTIDYKIYFNNVLVSSNNSYNAFMNYSSSGYYVIEFVANDSSGNTSESYTLQVYDIPLIVITNSPISKAYNTRNINVNVHVSTYADYCNYYVDSSLNGQMVKLDAGQNFNANILLGQDGSYTLNVNCHNAFDSSNTSVTFSIDTVNPVITSQSYSIDNYHNVTLNSVTDSVCVCKYDSSDKSYDSMSSYFTTTNSIQHSTRITGLSDGSYTYYIKCRNAIGNIANTASVYFTISTPLSAAISLSESSPIKSGTYKVYLTTTRPIIAAPVLYYTFDGESTQNYITMTGSGSSWSGYMIIEDDTPNKIGTFHYSATDYNQNVGSLVTSGEVFLVDTTKPVAPSSLEAITQIDGSIKIRWYYDGESVHRYNIYRSLNSEPEYVDYYTSTTAEQYVDNDVIDGITYYYKIAAIDEADNDGVLSNIVEALSTRRVSVVSKNDPVVLHAALNVGLVPKVDQFISELNNYLTDIDSLKSEFNQINDPAKLGIINILGLAESFNSAKSKIDSISLEADALKDEDLQSSELDVRLNKLKMDAIKAKSGVVEDIIVSSQSSFDQVTQAADVDNAILEALVVNLSKAVLDDYSLSNKQLQDRISVKTEVFIFKIKYFGKDDYDRYTLVKKVVSSSQQVENVSIIEVIPKSFESKATDLVLDINGQSIPTIVKDDPVLRWDSSKFNSQTIYYMSNSNAELSSAKDAKTVVLYTPNFKVTQTVTSSNANNTDSGLLTGLVGLNVPDIAKFSFMQWLVILGVGMILGLSTYYVVLDKKEKRRNVQRLREHRIISRPMVPGQSNMQAQSVQSRTVSNAQLSKPSMKSSNTPVSVAATSLNVSNIIHGMDLNNALEKANELINNFDYENARTIYNHCMKKFPSTKFKNNSQRDEIDMTMNYIYLKLVAYRAIHNSRKHAATKSHALVRQDLSMIQNIHSKLSDNLSKIDEDHKNAEAKFVAYIEDSRKHVEKIAAT